ncbi:hypothetical protein [Azospirillum endophyticum]
MTRHSRRAAVKFGDAPGASTCCQARERGKPRISKLFSCCDFAVTMKYLIAGVVQREVFQKSPSDGKPMIAVHRRIKSTNPRRR